MSIWSSIRRKHKGRAVHILAICLAASLLMYGYVFTMISLEESQAEPNKPEEDGKCVAVLLFHAVTEEEEYNDSVISSEHLAETFQALKENGYNPISLGRFHGFIDQGEGIPEKAILITFDDGYKDIYDIVYPLTQQYNFPAVVFTICKWFDRYPRPENSRAHLSVGEAQELLASGLWQIGSHGYDGHHLVKGMHNTTGAFLVKRAFLTEAAREETKEEYQARAWQDITMSTIMLKAVGVYEPRDFAFPYGRYNNDLIKLLNEAGYRYLFNNDEDLVRAGQDPSRIPRFVASHNAAETIAILNESFRQMELQLEEVD